MPKQFNIEEQYQRYLKMVKLNEEQMPEEQRVETRRAYFGAVGQFFIWLTNDFHEMEDNECEKALDNIREQTSKFWNNEVANHEG